MSYAATPKEKHKKVSFVDQVKVFPSTGVTDEAKKDRKEGLVYGDEGLKTVLNCGAHQEVRKCWKEIQAAFLGG